MHWILTSNLIHSIVESPRKSELDGPRDGLVQPLGCTRVEMEAPKKRTPCGPRVCCSRGHVALGPSFCTCPPAPARRSSSSARHFQIHKVGRIQPTVLRRGVKGGDTAGRGPGKVSAAVYPQGGDSLGMVFRVTCPALPAHSQCHPRPRPGLFHTSAPLFASYSITQRLAKCPLSAPLPGSRSSGSTASAGTKATIASGLEFFPAFVPLNPTQQKNSTHYPPESLKSFFLPLPCL